MITFILVDGNYYAAKAYGFPIIEMQKVISDDEALEALIA